MESVVKDLCCFATVPKAGIPGGEQKDRYKEDTMKRKRLLAILAVATAFSYVLSACSVGGDKPNKEQVIVEETVEESTPTPEPSPTEEPQVWEPVYTSQDGSMSIEMPDQTWSNKTDANGIVSIESDSGKIVIIHGKDEDMDTLVLPDSEDMAITLEKAKELEDGEFEVMNYSNRDQNGANVIYYTVSYSNTEKSDGVYREIVKYISNADEYYEITGDLTTDDEEMAGKVITAVNSFKILGASSLAGTGETAQDDGREALSPEDGTEDGTSEGELVDAEPADDSSGSDGYTDGYSDDDLADTNRTRTIYLDSDVGIVITNNDDGTWSDENGNVYTFDSSDDSIVRNQDDVDYFYNGEPGNVRYMYRTEGE